jgi:hypothetical protein
VSTTTGRITGHPWRLIAFETTACCAGFLLARVFARTFVLDTTQGAFPLPAHLHAHKGVARAVLTGADGATLVRILAHVPRRTGVAGAHVVVTAMKWAAAAALRIVAVVFTAKPVAAVARQTREAVRAGFPVFPLRNARATLTIMTVLTVGIVHAHTSTTLTVRTHQATWARSSLTPDSTQTVSIADLGLGQQMTNATGRRTLHTLDHVVLGTALQRASVRLTGIAAAAIGVRSPLRALSP